MQGVSDAPELGGFNMSDTTFDLHQCLTGHVDALQLQQLHQLGLLDVLSQTDAAYILPDADAVLLDFLFHGLTSHKIMVRAQA